MQPQSFAKGILRRSPADLRDRLRKPKPRPAFWFCKRIFRIDLLNKFLLSQTGVWELSNRKGIKSKTIAVLYLQNIIVFCYLAFARYMQPIRPQNHLNTI